MVEVTTGPRLRGALATALEQRRDRYNAAFAQARHARPRLDGEAFSTHLCERVAPIVEAVARIAPASVPLVVEVLYDVSLEMLGTDLLRRPEMERVWTEVLPSVPHLLAASPRRVVASLCNAAYQIASFDDVDINLWLAYMRAGAPSTQRGETLLAVGQAIAWRAGMAHYREGALAALESLPRELAAWALDLSPDLCEPRLTAMREDRWLGPSIDPAGAPSLRIANRVGGFRGFGKQFVRPPIISAEDDQLFVTDGADTWLLTADVFGATFHRASAGARSQGAGPFRLERDGTVQWGPERRRMAVLAEARSWASTSDTLGVTVPTSHFVYLVARTRG